MKAKHREILNAEIGKRLESMLDRFGQVSELAPWIPAGESHSALRRTAARLRDGTVSPADPQIPPPALADMIETSIAQTALAASVAKEMNEYKEISRSIVQKEEAERTKRAAARFHRLKKSPEAADPESPAAERVRRIHRTRRKDLGRPRRKKP